MLDILETATTTTTTKLSQRIIVSLHKGLKRENTRKFVYSNV